MKLEKILKLSEEYSENKLYKWAIYEKPPITTAPDHLQNCAWYCMEESDFCLEYHAGIWTLTEFELVFNAMGEKTPAIGLRFKSPTLSEVEKYLKHVGFEDASSIPITIEYKLEKMHRQDNSESSNMKLENISEIDFSDPDHDPKIQDLEGKALKSVSDKTIHFIETIVPAIKDELGFSYTILPARSARDTPRAIFSRLVRTFNRTRVELTLYQFNLSKPYTLLFNYFDGMPVIGNPIDTIQYLFKKHVGRDLYAHNINAGPGYIKSIEIAYPSSFTEAHIEFIKELFKYLDDSAK